MASSLPTIEADSQEEGRSAARDVKSRLYATIIRQLIQHENEVTNHRLMWLLLIQGLIVNAYVNARVEMEFAPLLAPLGILVTLSAFVMLYKSYNARGYLGFIGSEAKRGALRQKDLPLLGWPPRRVKGWRRRVWICPWLGRGGDLLEPYLFLPALLMLMWAFVILRHLLVARAALLLFLSALVVVVILSIFSVVWVWVQSKDETEPVGKERLTQSGTETLRRSI